MLKLSRVQIGYLELSLAQVFLAVHIILAKILSVNHSIFSLLTIRFLIGFFILAIYLLIASPHRLHQQIKKLNTKQWINLFFLTLCGGFLFNILNLYGLQRASASATSIINSALPAFTALLSFLILKENLSKYKLAGIILSVLGILLLNFGNVILHDDYSEVSGMFFVFLAIVPAALFIIYSKIIENFLDPLVLTLLINLINLLLFLPFFFNENASLLSNATITEWFQILLYAISGSILFFIFWQRGLKEVTVNTSALFIGIMPISVCILASIFLSEDLSTFELMGMICVIASIFVGTLTHPLQQPTTKNST